MVVNLASTGSNARVYIVNGGGASNIPDWLAPKKKGERRRRNKADSEQQGLRLIQDFDFPEASNKIKTTKDGQYCLVTGTYKPRLKIYDLVELGLKSERVTDSENVDFAILSDDWTKTLHLQADRSLSVHTAASVFYSTRIPKHGRALAYHFPSCDALVGAQGNQIYRLNLDQGRFLNSLECQTSVAGVNALDLNPAHGLLACGTDSIDAPGTVEFWDLRSRRRAGILEMPASQLQGATSFSADGVDAPLSVTSLASRTDGLNLAVGTSTGHTLLYDLRANAPYTIKDQGYGMPIKKIEWCYSSASTDSNEAGGYVATVDAKVMKIWGAQSSNNLISINPPNDINDMHIYPASGLVMLANEASPVTAYYVPQLGQAPKWCRFLDNMTEEMEQDTVETLYDDYKFVDRAELQQLGMDHLVGTETLKPYMHGFFVDLRLYTKARAIANPFAYAEYRDRLVREKMEKEQESRIRASKTSLASQSKKAKEAAEAVKSASVNRDLAEKIRLREEKEEQLREKKAAKRAAVLASREAGKGDADAEEADAQSASAKPQPKAGAQSILTDSRFGALFQDPEFEVDEDTLEFAMLNPSTVARKANQPKDRQEIGAEYDDASDDQAEDVEDDENQVPDGDSDSNSSDEGDLGQYDPRVKNGRAAPGQVDERTGKRRAPNQVKEREAKREVWAASKAAAKARAVFSEAPRTYRPKLVVDNGEDAFGTSADQTFGQRAHKTLDPQGSKKSRSGRAVPRGAAVDSEDGVIRSIGGGGMEYSFVPKTTSAQDRIDEERLQRKQQRMDKQAKDNIAKGRFGAGLEKGTAASESARAQLDLGEDERSGRKSMRRPFRSASRNKTRNL